MLFSQGSPNSDKLGVFSPQGSVLSQCRLWDGNESVTWAPPSLKNLTVSVALVATGIPWLLAAQCQPVTPLLHHVVWVQIKLCESLDDSMLESRMTSTEWIQSPIPK